MTTPIYPVLGIIASFHGEQPPRLDEDDFASYLKTDSDEVCKALKELLSNGWVEHNNGQWWLTTAGEEAIEEARANPHLVKGDKRREWVDEALTGITAKGKRSAIDWAALHGGEARIIDDHEATIHRRIAEQRAMKKRCDEIGRRLHLSNIEVSQKIGTGEIDLCPRCKEYQLFGRDKGRPTGWDSYCKRCRAAMARERRVK